MNLLLFFFFFGLPNTSAGRPGRVVRSRERRRPLRNVRFLYRLRERPKGATRSAVFSRTRDGAGGEGRGEKKETLEDEGPAEEKGQLLVLSYGNGNEVGHGAGTMGGQRLGERPRVNCFLLGSHLAPFFTG